MATSEHFDFDHIHTTPEGRHFRHGDGVEVDGEGNPMATVKMSVMDYTTGDRLGAAEIDAATAARYAACAAPAFQWPEGIASAADVLDAADLGRLGIDGRRVIWLD